MLPKLKMFVTLVILMCMVLLVGVAMVHSEEELVFSPIVKDEPWTLPYVSMPNHSLEQIMYMNYAWEVSHDKTFLYLLKAENGQVSPYRKHTSSSIGTDWGFCGINDYYHPEVVNSPEFLTDWRGQIVTCYRMYKEGVRFYGLDKIDKVKHFFKFNE